MKKRKLVFLVTLSLLVTGAMSVHAQGTPVFDVTNLIQAIEMGYTMYDQLNAAIQNVQNSYESIQNQIKNMQALQMKDLDITDPLGSWRSIMTYANRLMTYEENIEHVLTSKTIKFGKKKLSYQDIFTTRPFNHIDEDGNVVEKGWTADAWDDPFERELTLEEKARFHRKYGMSYGHYMRYNALGQEISKQASHAAVYFENLLDNVNEDREKLDTIVATEPELDSAIAQAQRNNAIMATMAQDMKTLLYTQAKVGQILAEDAYKAEVARKNAEETPSITDLSQSGEYYDILAKTDEDIEYK